MKGLPEERAVLFAEYIIENRATVRATAAKFGISKSTVHKDVTERLFKISSPLYMEVAKVLEINRNERHIRGGNATRLKFSHKREEKLSGI